MAKVLWKFSALLAAAVIFVAPMSATADDGCPPSPEQLRERTVIYTAVLQRIDYTPARDRIVATFKSTPEYEQNPGPFMVFSVATAPDLSEPECIPSRAYAPELQRMAVGDTAVIKAVRTEPDGWFAIIDLWPAGSPGGEALMAEANP